MTYLNYGPKQVADILADTDDLGQVERAIVRERAIRQGMAKTGEGREVVAETLDAMQSMDQEAVLDLAEGQPTTLQDALARYVRILETWDEVIPRDRVMTDLDAILEHPWSQEEAVIALHESNDSLRLEFRHPDDEHVEAWLGGQFLWGANHDDHGWTGMLALESSAKHLYRAVLARVIADRDHHVQLNAAQTADLRKWLARPNGSMVDRFNGRLSVDAVAGGGVLVRTKPYSYQAAARLNEVRRRAEEGR